MKWLEITVTTAPPAVEAVADLLLSCRAGGVAEETVPSGQVKVRAYLPAGPSSAVALRALRGLLRRLPEYGLDAGRATVEAAEIDDERWAEAWKEYTRPFAVGRLWITPTWDRTPAPEGSVVVELDPGMAFGSGQHPSTRLCLDVVSRLVAAGMVVFDIGAGSGILAVAAAKLGAGRVLARDLDPLAVEVARRNVVHNAVADRVTVEEGNLLQGVADQAHLILANLTADLHLEFLPQAQSRLLPGGRLAASGIVAERVADVVAAARRVGLATEETLAEGEWRCLVLRPFADPAGADAGR
ncbi:MAG: 50S ribosomal protein L11 methyltransferase [Armatimonadota bacterium]|nr:50S ribosomal protein L11 methyltransferase [Armatimonadota bacterium]MDR7451245.1 50S ribosomal protein L11 methyltransferase [Armatimonadota bacterium]MDR7466852.1 50S ribosomal protein L11 methyltransferase [Armatimonadota bacterium]MDR7492675.1 50S ribosomal protein L11 methyltransferase [Armatimonadota bacterium]MDR7499604.1 50S ribosomal protein L11 methyltransferase [Armatimonadota bacterium]